MSITCWSSIKLIHADKLWRHTQVKCFETNEFLLQAIKIKNIIRNDMLRPYTNPQPKFGCVRLFQNSIFFFTGSSPRGVMRLTSQLSLCTFQNSLVKIKGMADTLVGISRLVNNTQAQTATSFGEWHRKRVFGRAQERHRCFGSF